MLGNLQTIEYDEKRGASELCRREVEHFLPTYGSIRRWLPHPFLTVGRRVRITGGPFAGLEGILRRQKARFRVVVSLELIQRSVVVDVDAADIVALV